MNLSTPMMNWRRETPLVALLALVLCLPDVAAGATSEADKPGVSRAAGVVAVATRAELLGTSYYEDLVRHDVDEASIVDGTLVLARLLCCRDNVMKSSPLYLYNPLAIEVAPGDFIELRIGDVSEQARGTVAEWLTITRVLQRAAEVDGECGWDPPDDRLWMRIVACEWMPAEGWVKQDKKLNPAWYKPPNPVEGR